MESLLEDFNVSNATMPLNDSVLCPANMTFSLFGHSHLVPRQSSVYLALAFLHLFFVVIPAVVLSSLALYERLRKHPANIIFCWILVVCIMGPCTYGLLMDLSLIFDQPVLGRCERRWEGIIQVLCALYAVPVYNFLLAFSAITFYVSLKKNITRVNIFKMNVIAAVVVACAFIHVSFWLILAESKFDTRCRIRGSFCFTFFSSDRTVITVLEVFRVGFNIFPVIFIAIAMSILYLLKVRSSVITLDRDVVKSIVCLFLFLAGGSVLWNLSTVILHFGSFDGTQRGLIGLLSTYTIQLNFILFPLLVLVLQKPSSFCAMGCCSCFNCCLCFDCCMLKKVTHPAEPAVRLQHVLTHNGVNINTQFDIADAALAFSNPESGAEDVNDMLANPTGDLEAS